MTDSLERSLQELRFEVPAGLVERALAAASDSAGARHSGRRAARRRDFDTRNQSWAPALVAVLLAAAIVATLLFAAHQRQAVPALPGPHGVTPYTIPSPPSAATGCTSATRQWATSPPHPARMLSPTTGWAHGPMRTTDGGAHWLNVSPPSIPGRTPANDEYFLDSTHAWVAETAGSPTACVDHVVIFSTVDAGRSWQQAAPIAVRYTNATDVIWTGAANHASWFAFADPQNGWLLVGSGPVRPGAISPSTRTGIESSWVGAEWSVGDLYRTTDGGLHWTLLASAFGSADGCLPASLNGRLHESPMSFSSPATGWLVTTCGLLVTRNGGLTWTRSPTQLQAMEAPLFFDQRRGLIPVDGGLLVTSDGGASWSVRAMAGQWGAIDFINPNEGWAVGAAANALFQLYRTVDGGRTWVPGSTSDLRLPDPKYWPPAYLHFFDAKTGFLDPGGPVEGLFITTDGGRTWTRVDGEVQGK